MRIYTEYTTMEEEESSEFQEAIRKARSFAEARNWEEVQRVLFPLLALKEITVKDRMHILNLVAKSYYETEDYRNSEKYSKEAIVLVTDAFGAEDPFVIPPLITMGRICKHDNDLKDSEEFFRIALGVYEESPDFVSKDQGIEIYVELLDLSVKCSKDFEMALRCVESLEALLEADIAEQGIDKKLISARLMHIFCLMALGRFHDAELLLVDVRASEMSKQQEVLALLYGALCKQFLGNAGECEKGLQESLVLAAKGELAPVTMTLLAALYAGSGREKEALDLVTEVSSMLDLQEVQNGENDGALHTDHLKGAGFHFVAELSDEESLKVRNFLLKQVEDLQEEAHYLFAYFILFYLFRAHFSIRGSEDELNKKIDSLSLRLINQDALGIKDSSGSIERS